MSGSRIPRMINAVYEADCDHATGKADTQDT
jgi:hypothetical protein